jgi:hypothetical protein
LIHHIRLDGGKTLATSLPAYDLTIQKLLYSTRSKLLTYIELHPHVFTCSRADKPPPHIVELVRGVNETSHPLASADAEADALAVSKASDELLNKTIHILKAQSKKVLKRAANRSPVIVSPSSTKAKVLFPPTISWLQSQIKSELHSYLRSNGFYLQRETIELGITAVDVGSSCL